MRACSARMLLRRLSWPARPYNPRVGASGPAAVSHTRPQNWLAEIASSGVSAQIPVRASWLRYPDRRPRAVAMGLARSIARSRRESQSEIRLLENGTMLCLLTVGEWQSLLPNGAPSPGTHQDSA